MAKKENQSKGGNTSLLQTARTKSYGAGRFASLPIKGGKSQPKIRNVDAPNSPKNGKAIDGEANDYLHKIYDVVEAESAVFGMSMNSKNSLEYSLPKAYISGTAKNVVGNGGAKQSASFFSLWPTSTGAVDPDQYHRQNQQQLKKKKFVKPTTQGTREVIVTNKKTMDISKGLRFSAPSPMTLNRYQPQIGQEKTAPESKEYLERQAMRKQKQTEAKYIAEAKMTIEDRLKQAFGLEEFGAALEERVEGYDNNNNNNKNTNANMPMRKKSLMKKILGKVRQKPSTKLQQNQEKSSAIQAAMAAAAAAVEAATGDPGGQIGGRNRPMTEEEARAIVSHALLISRQKKKTTSPHEMLDQLAPQVVDDFGRPIHFPINEVMMSQNEDSVSELDSSLRNRRKMPVAEVRMNNSSHYHGNESVSTLGTPRVFEQLDKLLLSESHGLQQRPGIIRDFLEDNMGGSAAPPPMVTSHDARALIDQIDSGTLVGDMTAGTAKVESAVRFCNIASNCFHPGHKSIFLETSARDHIFASNISALGDESYYDDDSEASSEERTNDDTWLSPNTDFTQAIDDAIRKAELQIASTKEVGEKISSKTSPRSYGGVSASHTEMNRQPEQETDTKLNNNIAETARPNQGFALEDAERNEKNTPEREKTFVKSPNPERSANQISMLDEGRFLLEKDDEYWDTLSTIASTANDQSSESDAYMDEYIRPGPIPGEITTPSGEMKPVSTPISSGKGTTIDKNQQFLSPNGGNLDEMINDVTDLIDANLLDSLPISKNRRPNISSALSPKKSSAAIDRNKNSKLTKRKTKQMKPCPEAVEESEQEETKNVNLATAASQLAKGIRSVSWGVEEIYENKNLPLDLSDQDTDNSGSSYDMAHTPRPYPEGMHKNPRRTEYADEVQQQPRGDEDLLSRTLELSKGLLETIMGGQSVQEKTKKDERNFSSDSGEMQSGNFDENQTSTESRDDFQHDDKSREDDLSPTINDRLESLRNQRSRALSKFRQSQLQMQTPVANHSNEKAATAKRDRERLKHISLGKLQSTEPDRAEYITYPNAILKQSQSNDSDIDLKYTTSDSNASTTPSQKARELRMQLDEAMRASRAIQISQNELGNELNSFKRKYYKNPEIQHSFATKMVRDF
mmetsp:Transcript_1014/g.2322  ORF Transcript_1014/g.2322 Transcript_1014/m.2322 type:complete len:1136 (-) Transcript_1014:79-3486(-)|eukprot:CAMPEP_0116132190 /NCGR_PEP_ID=MMETSP0329-20121206/9415_1 /TAXON_ID=697910 /ORGANISM="Pseudo-nitzschia arenysensis, Strain B593" /LENGTH=1135 /DNA_ID=CAMNT_0003626687 /DNA_START=125 /DNA_END=3532 /DNA_ORIENTATION=+